MKYFDQLARTLVIGLVGLVSAACSGSNSSTIPQNPEGGTTNVGGTSALGGNGGAITGGRSGTSSLGGRTSYGGSGGSGAANSGGTLASRGWVANGGVASTAVGGSPGLGGAGASSVGGTNGIGGRASMGGTSNTGGVTNGGTTAGGASPTGGRAAIGGQSTGGRAATGGQSTGGRAATGGQSTGGQSTGVYLPNFIIGADITITVEDEYWGATYTDTGTQKSIEQLLKDHGFNFIRIDTFVNPAATNGYAATMPEPFRDLTHTIGLAKRVKQIGLGFMLDLHYSDTWTNPSAQATPAAWAGLTLSALETRVYEYTKDALTQLRNAGALPDIVQVGNEITNGMLWDAGRITNNDFRNFATLLKAGIRAVREVNPAIQILLHIEKCNDSTTSQWWLDGVLAQGVAFDILGQSCYATAPNGVTGYQGTPAQWQATFSALAARYPNLKFMIAEYSAEQRAANDTMFNLPNRRGLGTFNWDPTRAYSTHPNHPLFSTNGAWNRYVAVPSLMALYDKMANDYGLRAVASPAP